MRKRSRLLLSGDGAEDCPEVVWLHINDERPNIELPPVVLDRGLLNERPHPHPWDKHPDDWYDRFQGADWIWTTSKFYQPRRTQTEELTVRRSFSLPAAARNARVHVVTCAVGGLSMYLDGKRVGPVKHEPTSANNFYAEFDRQEEIDSDKTHHVWEFCVKRSVIRTEHGLPVGGLIYCLDLVWQEPTKVDIVKRFTDAWFGAVRSRFFRIVGFLGFIAFLFFALFPRFDETTRTIFAGVAVGFLSAWLSPLVQVEIGGDHRKADQE